MPFGSHMTVTTFAAPYARLCHGRRRRQVANSSMRRRPTSLGYWLPRRRARRWAPWL